MHIKHHFYVNAGIYLSSRYTVVLSILALAANVLAGQVTDCYILLQVLNRQHQIRALLWHIEVRTECKMES